MIRTWAFPLVPRIFRWSSTEATGSGLASGLNFEENPMEATRTDLVGLLIFVEGAMQVAGCGLASRLEFPGCWRSNRMPRWLCARLSPAGPG